MTFSVPHACHVGSPRASAGTCRCVTLWQALAGAASLRQTWSAQEAQASQAADEAVQLEEEALALEQAGQADEASAAGRSCSRHGQGTSPWIYACWADACLSDACTLQDSYCSYAL